MRKIWMALGTVLTMAAGGAWAAGGPPSLESRIDAWASYSVAGATCESLGYVVQPERFEQVAVVMAAEGGKVGMAEDRMSQLFQQAKSRHLADLNARNQVVKAALSQAMDDPYANGPALKAQLGAYSDFYGRRCAAAAADPVFKPIVTAPPAASLAAAKRDYMDALLAPAGQASWQTIHMVAQADVLYAVGVCRNQLRAADITRYTAVLAGPAPTDPAQARIRAYYQGQYQQGLDAAAELGLDDVQCGRVMDQRLAKLKENP